MPTTPVTVSGAATTPFNRRKDGSCFRDWAKTAFDAALEMAALDPCDIDAFFFASESDFFTLQLNPSSILATDLGLTGCAVLRCEGGGASGQAAVHAGFDAIMSGRMRHVVVLGADASASSLSADTMRALYGQSFEMWSDGLTGVTSTTLYALSYMAFAEEHGTTNEDLAAVTLQNRRNACLNPNAHLQRTDSLAEVSQSALVASPYRRLHCSPLSDGAAAIILSHQDALPQNRKQAPRIAGIGAATDHAHLGARAKPGDFVAKTRAMQRALKMANITGTDIDIAEIYDAYAGAQIQALQALGLAENATHATRSGEFAPTGRCPVNLSGGLLGQGAPVGATGVGQTATCALLLEGLYHQALQPQSLPRYALADTHGGICTNANVTILQQGAVQ